MKVWRDMVDEASPLNCNMAGLLSHKKQPQRVSFRDDSGSPTATPGLGASLKDTAWVSESHHKHLQMNPCEYCSHWSDNAGASQTLTRVQLNKINTSFDLTDFHCLLTGMSYQPGKTNPTPSKTNIQFSFYGLLLLCQELIIWLCSVVAVPTCARTSIFF